MEGDIDDRRFRVREVVSIRAPAWRATGRGAARGRAGAVSIRAPAWRATRLRSGPASPGGFQSAPPHGGRRAYGMALEESEYVSIRAPAWRATRATAAEMDAPTMFQSAPPHGGRPDPQFRLAARLAFQSAPPHGGRRARSPWIKPVWASFNPRPRMEGDVARAHRRELHAGVSIRAPAWRATGGDPGQRGRREVSIRAPAWRATQA